MNSATTIPLAVSMGDPAGIGPEICAKSVLVEKLPAGVTPIVIGDLELFRQSSHGFFRDPVLVTPETTRDDLEPEKFHFLDAHSQLSNLEQGTASAAGGRASARYIDIALDLISNGCVDGLITAPISKKAWRLAGIEGPGHTEYLRRSCGCERTEMLFWSHELRVALFTTHVPLRESIGRVNRKSLVSFITFVAGELVKLGHTGLRIAVAGLNPHAGESGLFGDEDELEIRPAVADCLAVGLDVSGPYPADSLFHSEARRTYDLVIALYHDQGLIPIKTLAFWQAVNVTLGLPFVRTSPAHGVAYDIAGKGVARADGMVSAIRTAARFIAGSVVNHHK